MSAEQSTAGRRAAAFAAILCLAAAAGALLWWGAERNAAACRPFAAPGAEVWLALGQSNAGNHGERRSAAGPHVAAFDGTSCVAAQDPLPGGDGDGGSLWTPLAERWVREGRASHVLVAVVSKEATAVSEWQPGTPLHRRALATVAALERRGLRVHRILWVQGEADAIHGTSGDTYASALAAAVQPLNAATGAPAWVAQTGRCGDAFSPAVRDAQARVAAALPWARPGPDLDLIGPDARFERCHFAAAGQVRAVDLWHAALVAGER
ncbi:MAG TPA: sialate O-acetylesterase [Allosphingosinicella sp.]|nr:sialate O-acetylesterase [Allosphingosinicella sp.]